MSAASTDSGNKSTPPPRFGAPLDVVAEVYFGRLSHAAPLDPHGLSMADQNNCWTDGTISGFSFAVTPEPGQLVLQLTLTPYVPPGRQPAQRLKVRVNGRDIGEAILRNGAVVAFELPEECAKAGRIDITLLHPDALSPFDAGLSADRRALAFDLKEALLIRVAPPRYIYAHSRPPLAGLHNRDPNQLAASVGVMTGLSIADLMMAFESLGSNCEFGMMQRHWRAEPLGLLRFCEISPPHLMTALNWGFAGIDTPEDLRVFVNYGKIAEFVAQNRRYGLTIHTLKRERETSAEVVRTEVTHNLRFLRRNFLEMLRAGQKLCVISTPDNFTLPEARALLLMLRSFGPVTLLYVTRGPAALSGTVASVEDGILHGIIDHFADLNRETLDINVLAWLSICANAYRLWREDGFGVAA